LRATFEANALPEHAIQHRRINTLLELWRLRTFIKLTKWTGNFVSAAASPFSSPATKQWI